MKNTTIPNFNIPFFKIIYKSFVAINIYVYSLMPRTNDNFPKGSSFNSIEYFLVIFNFGAPWSALFFWRWFIHSN